MEVRVERGDIAQYQADAIVVNLFEGITSPGGGTGAVDRALDGAISRVIADGDCRGKDGELTLIHTLGKLPSPRVVVAGTTATDDSGRLVGAGHPYAQAVQAFRNIEAALGKAGAALRHVVRTRIYLTDIAHWEEIGRAHAEFFAQVRPACTLVAVSRLLEPEMLVEIEVDAVIVDGS